METDRIAGLSLAARPLHALVVLQRKEGRWLVERVRTADTLGGFSDPGCPVVIDATGFWQAADHHIGGTDAELLRGMGWLEVRAPVTVKGIQRNPRRVDLESNLDEMMDLGRLRPVMVLDPVKLDALRLAAWGARQVDEQQAAEQFRARLMPWQRATCEQLDAWQATDEPLAIVVGDRGSGKTHAVKAWAETSGLRVETFEPDNASAAKYARCNVSVFRDAARHVASNVVDALHGSRVVLIANVPSGFQDRGRWVVNLVDAIRSGDAPGRVIECRAARTPLPARIAGLARLIDPEAR